MCSDAKKQVIHLQLIHLQLSISSYQSLAISISISCKSYFQIACFLTNWNKGFYFIFETNMGRIFQKRSIEKLTAGIRYMAYHVILAYCNKLYFWVSKKRKSLMKGRNLRLKKCYVLSKQAVYQFLLSDFSILFDPRTVERVLQDHSCQGTSIKDVWPSSCPKSEQNL